jgi:hypothetical protein
VYCPGSKRRVVGAPGDESFAPTKKNIIIKIHENDLRNPLVVFENP